MTESNVKAPEGMHTITPHIVVSDATADWSPLSVGGTATVLHLSTNDVDALWKRAVDAGAEVRQPLQDVFWGERYGQITDPFGHRWGLAQHVRDVPREEVQRAATEFFSGSS